jgi:hypothetical protein
MFVVPFVIFWVYAAIAFFALDTKVSLIFISGWLAGFLLVLVFRGLLLFFGIWQAVLAAGIWFRMRMELW